MDTTCTRGGIVKNVSGMNVVNERPFVLLVKVSRKETKRLKAKGRGQEFCGHAARHYG